MFFVASHEVTTESSGMWRRSRLLHATSIARSASMSFKGTVMPIGRHHYQTALRFAPFVKKLYKLKRL